MQLRWLDLHTDLAEGLLTKVDRTSMAHSLEVRPPLLDHRLVEFMLSVDPALLVDRRKRRGKLLVRRLMQPRLPPGHLERPKSGFGLPVHRWLKSHPRVLREAVARLRERAACCDARWAPSSAGRGRCWCSTDGSPPLAEPGLRILFVPVSGPYGMGEFARCSAIASAALERWPARLGAFRAEPTCSLRCPSAVSRDAPALVGDISFGRGHRAHAQLAPQRRDIRQCRAQRAARGGASARSAHRVHQFSPAPAAAGLSLCAGCVSSTSTGSRIRNSSPASSGFVERAKLKLLRRPVGALPGRDHRAPRAAASADASGAEPDAAAESGVVVIPGGGTGHPGGEDAAAAISGRGKKSRGGRDLQRPSWARRREAAPHRTTSPA